MCLARVLMFLVPESIHFDVTFAARSGEAGSSGATKNQSRWRGLLSETVSVKIRLLPWLKSCFAMDFPEGDK